MNAVFKLNALGSLSFGPFECSNSSLPELQVTQHRNSLQEILFLLDHGEVPTGSILKLDKVPPDKNTMFDSVSIHDVKCLNVSDNYMLKRVSNNDNILRTIKDVSHYEFATLTLRWST
jgi:hypothetical protein